jgi:DNA mismatch endonuclease (patch repair protein)
VTDCFNPHERSRIMSRIRSSGNYSTEVRFIQMMRQYKISGWRRRSKLPGKPDFLFPKHKLAVFIDGDFWHGNPRKFRIPKTNCDYWSAKILRNRERDKMINRTLRKEGWRVLRIWESSLRDIEAVIGKLSLWL